jgi:hypothetical protein
MRTVSGPTAAPVKIVTGQTPGAERQRCRALRRRGRESAGGGGRNMTSRTSRPSRSPASNAASYISSIGPTGKIAELVGGDVRGSEVLPPATINRISWQPIPVDAP